MKWTGLRAVLLMRWSVSSRHHDGCRPRRNQFQCGVTLLELMVTLTILTILASIAVPSFQELLKRHRVRVAVEALSSTLYLARSEAIKRGGNIVMRKTATASCPGAATTGRWECGWQIFVDDNGNTTLDDGETLLRETGVQRGVVITRGPATNVKRFTPWGHAAGLGTFNYLVWPVQDAVAQPANYRNAILLCMGAGGRLRSVHGQAPPCA